MDRIHDRQRAIRKYVSAVPDRTSWVKYLPIPLEASDPEVAHAELVARLRTSGPDWFYVTYVRADGRRFGYASDLFRPQQPNSPTHVGQFLLFDIHSSLAGWWVSHLWRAVDLAEATCASLRDWLVLPAAACARALVEGVAAFVIEGEQLLAEWSEFKRRGMPDVPAIMAFRERFNMKLLQAQFGSRVGERAGTRSPRLKRTNVMTLLEKFAKRAGTDVLTSYEWLCDAVHPSFGFHTAYVATQGLHNTGATMVADLTWRTDKARTHIPKIEPTVAWAGADVFIISADAILVEAPRLRWFVDDFGLTTGVAFATPGASIGRTSKTDEDASCPCASGRRFRVCRHAWGDHAEPPSVQRS